MVGRQKTSVAGIIRLLLLIICVGMLLIACQSTTVSEPTIPLQVNQPFVDQNFIGGDLLISGHF